MEEDFFEPDECILDPDEEYARNYIIGRIVDATEIMTDLVDYLTNSPYVVENGGEKFKKELEKANKIQEALDNFWNDGETRENIF